MNAIEIPPALLVQIYAHARRAYPAECCGYVRGDAVIECRNAQLDGDHPTTPERGEETGFVIAGAELLAFAKSFDTSRPALVVYHSHTNGRAYFSSVDHEVSTVANAPTYPVQHLVVGVTASAVVEAAQFAWDAGDWVEVARWSTS